jgi:hypothetical protein
MQNLFYIVAVILVVGWLIGLIGFNAGGAIHQKWQGPSFMSFFQRNKGSFFTYFK